MTVQQKKDILKVMEDLSGIAEYEKIDLKDFLNMPEYELLREEYRFLIIGGRGSGKTYLYSTLLTEDGFNLIMHDNSMSGFNSHIDLPLVGFSPNDPFPSSEVLAQCITDKDATTYWAGSLLFVTLQKITDSALHETIRNILGDELYSIFSNINYLPQLSNWLFSLRSKPEIWERALKEIDTFLSTKRQRFFLIYDYLDRVATEYSNLFPFIRTLISFWFRRISRWKNIYCKIFLRNDLFESNQLYFPDASKLGRHIIRLKWRPAALYQLLVKRLANSESQVTIDYLQQTNGLISDCPLDLSGYSPTNNVSILENFISRLIGRYMGKTPKKGSSFLWIPNHLQDANGVLAPRSFLKCFSASAKFMSSSPCSTLDQLSNDQLILPSAIQRAVMEVSRDRVAELQEEYPWLSQLQTAFNELTMLMDRDDFIDHIDMRLWSQEDRKMLPEQTPQGLFSILQELGIVLVTPENRVNVPEIYLHGFNMKRKGGIRRAGD